MQMMDPRKPVITVTGSRQAEITSKVHRRLIATTEAGAKELGTTGASFVIIATGVYVAELREVDAYATAKLLRAMADLFDPKSNENKKVRAEKDRAQAVRKLLAGIDLEMAEGKGNA